MHAEPVGIERFRRDVGDELVRPTGVIVVVVVAQCEVAELHDVPLSRNACCGPQRGGIINVLAIIANAIVVTSSFCLYQAWSRGARAPLQRESCERPLMSDRLDLANYLPYLVNRL